MKLRFFTIPIRGGDEAAEELNRFLGTHRILAVDRSFVQDGPNSAWTLCVSFDTAEGSGGGPQAGADKRGKVDYREILNEQDFAVYAKLRTLRKELAEKEGIPAYAVLTNEQMAEMVKRRVQNVTALREIAGIGDARIGKYGERFLRLLQEALALPAADTLPF
jgi:superfamily II DNA helicase RecQ